jgi:fucose 4-O-acetylase-like acetyltransferase
VSGETRRRDDGLDAARGLGIALVIVGHALEAQFLDRPDGVFFTPSFRIWQAIYAFHMPLFFLLSGAANRDIADKPFGEVLRGSVKLILLVWFFHVLVAMIGIGSGWLRLPPGVGIDSLLSPFVTGRGWSMSVLWFLVSLAIVRVLVHTLLARRSIVAVAAATVAMGLGLAALVGPKGETLHQIATWVPGAAFFAIGVFLGRHPRHLPGPALGVAALATSVALAGLDHGCRWSLADVCASSDLAGHAAVRMVFGDYGNLPLFAVTALLGAVGAWSLAARFGGAYLVAMGRSSLTLYLLNGTILVFLGPVGAAVATTGGAGVVFHVVWVAAAVPIHLALAPVAGRVVGLLSGVADRIAVLVLADRRAPVA